MDNLKLISVGKDFSVHPGPRNKVEGPLSGELFRQTILEPAFKEAFAAGKKLQVSLDGTLGYGTSFLEEAFGGLARIHGVKEVEDTLEIISNEEPYLKKDVADYIREAKN